jgi:hypothetical protein
MDGTMVSNVLRRKGSAAARPGDGQVAIGEADGGIFNCPVCARPLATGASRCPGCATRLLMGVPAGKASTLLGAGGAAGLIVGGTIVALVLFAMNPQASTPARAGGASSSPTTTGGGGGTPVAAPVPVAAVNALAQASGLNSRLSLYQVDLAAAVKPSKPKGAEVARILRAIATDATSAAGTVSALSSWPDGRLLAFRLEDFYADVRAATSSALKVSLTNGSAYRKNGQKVVELLDRIPELQSDARAIAQAYGIDIGL